MDLCLSVLKQIPSVDHQHVLYIVKRVKTHYVVMYMQYGIFVTLHHIFKNKVYFIFCLPVFFPLLLSLLIFIFLYSLLLQQYKYTLIMTGSCTFWLWAVIFSNHTIRLINLLSFQRSSHLLYLFALLSLEDHLENGMRERKWEAAGTFLVKDFV